MTLPMLTMVGLKQIDKWFTQVHLDQQKMAEAMKLDPVVFDSIKPGPAGPHAAAVTAMCDCGNCVPKESNYFSYEFKKGGGVKFLGPGPEISFMDKYGEFSPLVQGPSVSGDTIKELMFKLLPAKTLQFLAKCPEPWNEPRPEVGSACVQRRLLDQIVHLNDTHRWTRERIADWLETLDADITFLTPEQQAEQEAQKRRDEASLLNLMQYAVHDAIDTGTLTAKSLTAAAYEKFIKQYLGPIGTIKVATWAAPPCQDQSIAGKPYNILIVNDPTPPTSGADDPGTPQA